MAQQSADEPPANPPRGDATPGEVTREEVDRPRPARFDDHASAAQIASITAALRAMSAFDFSADIPVHGTADPVDALARAARELQRELGAHVVSPDRLHALLESMPNPVALIDEAGRIVQANSLMGRLLAPSGGDDITDDFMSWVNACLPETSTLTLSYWTEPVQVPCTLSEVEYHYLFSMAPVVSQLEAAQGFVVVGTDISNQVRVERQLARAKEMAEAHAEARSAFLANMSHEIRTPLFGIVGSTELLMSALASSDSAVVNEHARIIHSCSKHLLALVNDILDFSRVDENKLVLESRALELPALLDDCMTSVKYSYRKDGVDARVALPAGLPRYVTGDPMRLRQIVMNLLGNAFKFTDRGHVELCAEIVERDERSVTVRVSVRDTGIGIEAEKLDNLFAPFEQGDASITRRYGGTGLGLAIAGHLVDLMQGQIGVDSRLGAGSTFWFAVTFPLASAEEPADGDDVIVAPSDQSSIADVSATIHGARILLVEDNVVSQRIAAMMLEQAGCEVTVAGHGAEALDRLAEAQFDVILMDCQMPVMDGLHATRELRRRERGSRTPVIALTADAFDAHRKDCLDAGMDGYLRKPVRKASLCRAIAEYWRR